MKNDKRLTRMYSALSASEKAGLAFAHIANLDRDAAKQVEATVTAKTYRTLDLEYQDRLKRLQMLAVSWGLFHWKEFAKFSAALSVLMNATEEDEPTLEVFGVFQKAEGRLIALDEMLASICQDKGIDPAAVRAIACAAAPWETQGDPVPDDKYTEEIRKLLQILAR
jgi:hypothetical protein